MVKERTTILVVGCGSIGIRHIRALKSLGVRNIFALRTRKGGIKELPEDIKGVVHEIFDEKKVKELKPTHVIISNPTSLHLKYLLKFTDTHTKIFVEKPIVNEYFRVEQLKKTMHDRIGHKEGMVGFNLRFHKVFQKIKGIVDGGKLGVPLYAIFRAGGYLPFWHPWEDYRKSYAARKTLGGGALRTLSHEFDLAQYLFGQVKKVTAKVEKLSKLKINVDDCVDAILITHLCKRVVIHIDYLWPLTDRRNGEILFEKALVEYDYFKGCIYKVPYRTRKRTLMYKVPETYDFDQQYYDQMKEFLSDKVKTGCSLQEGIENLRIIEG